MVFRQIKQKAIVRDLSIPGKIVIIKVLDQLSSQGRFRVVVGYYRKEMSMSFGFDNKYVTAYIKFSSVP